MRERNGSYEGKKDRGGKEIRRKIVREGMKNLVKERVQVLLRMRNNEEELAMD